MTPPVLASVATALAEALPLSAPATVGEAAAAGQQPADLFPLLPPGAGTVVVAALEPGNGEVAVVVGSALTQALAESPLGELDIAAAIQPALDAAALAAGASAGPARSVDLDAAVADLFAKPDAWLVPLNDTDGWVCATVVLVAPTTAEPFVADAPSASPAEVPVTEPALDASIPRQVSPARSVAGMPAGAGLDLLRDVVMEVTVELGRARMTISELLSLSPGAVVELDRAAGSPADLLVNGTLLARGEVVVVDEDFGIRITEIVGPVGADAAVTRALA